jgi:acetoin utilization deacetylase AcuC-like enzyme
MKVVFADGQLAHDPQTFFSSGALVPHPEKPERALRLLAAAERTGLERQQPAELGLEYALDLHTPRYLEYLQHIFPRWTRIEGASHEVVPGIHPDERSGGYPDSAAGQAGVHQRDLSCPINADTWTSVLWSAHTAAQAAVNVLDGDSASYALCRPPGHHATRDYAAGFCYLGNTAIAALALRERHERVAILDVDVHHGNGTQDLFYDRGDVLTVSIHADPIRFYPFHWGYRSETGQGDGLGANINVPLARGTADDAYLRELDDALSKIAAFGPGALVIALGLDAFEGDPFRGFAITTPGFGRIASLIGELRLPTVLVQEGGYLSDELGENLASFLEGFRAAHDG